MSLLFYLLVNNPSYTLNSRLHVLQSQFECSEEEKNLLLSLEPTSDSSV